MSIEERATDLASYLLDHGIEGCDTFEKKYEGYRKLFVKIQRDAAEDARKKAIEECAEMAAMHWAGVRAADCSGVYAAKEIAHSIRALAAKEAE